PKWVHKKTFCLVSTEVRGSGWKYRRRNMASSICPSHFFPGYLKQDFRVGSVDEHPVSQALSLFSRRLAQHVWFQSYALAAEKGRTETQKQQLRLLGFRCETLNSSDTQKFYDMRMD